jgi:hypothetical protein
VGAVNGYAHFLCPAIKLDRTLVLPTTSRMTIHVSKDFEKRFKCGSGMTRGTVLQAGRLDAWSAHCVRLSCRTVAIFMNDATLCTILIPVEDSMDFPQVVHALLCRIDGIWPELGLAFDETAESVIVLPRSNRALISSMNEAIRCIKWRDEIAFTENYLLDLEFLEAGVNEMPYKALSYDSPNSVLAELRGLTG